MKAAGLQTQVAIVGAGAFGAWTALTLRERGADVLLIDSHGPGNNRSSSGGDSRNIRAAYGDREIYTRWAIASWSQWKEREREFGQRLLYPCGSLRSGDEKDLNAQAEIFARLEQPFEILAGNEAERRWPQLSFRGIDRLFYEPLSGILLARDALVEVTRAVIRKGGKMIIARAELRPDLSKPFTLWANGARIEAESVVLACGPWLPKLLPTLLGDRIHTPRRELFFIAPEAGDRRFDWDRCPNISDSRSWTSSDIGGGFKVAPKLRHRPMDPDDGDRMPTASLLDEVRAYLRRRAPDLAERPVASTFVSQLENSANEHFLIDRHPDDPRLFIAGAGSGHAFKMGPVIGAYVADLVLGQGQQPGLQDLFAIAAHRAIQPGEAG
jgi:glycine/D-amino acid oxidase-like deaminating enzyme